MRPGVGRIPPGSVVVSGNLPGHDGRYSLYCAVIIKQVDAKTRAILFDPAVKVSPEAFKAIREICPFDIPRQDEKSGGMAKYTMCFDRISEGLLPACVKSCPTGTMNFGDRDAMLKMAGKRLDEVKRTHRMASLIIPESVRVIFLVKDDPVKYHKFASREGQVGITRRMALQRFLDPVARAVRS